MIHVGVSMESTSICIERQSFNLDYCIGDEVDKCPAKEICVEEGSVILVTKLDVDKLCEVSNTVFKCGASKACCEPSIDPGR